MCIIIRGFAIHDHINTWHFSPTDRLAYHKNQATQTKLGILVMVMVCCPVMKAEDFIPLSGSGEDPATTIKDTAAKKSFIFGGT